MTHRTDEVLKHADFSDIRNRNESRVRAAIGEALADMGHANMPEEMVRDIFAYALNQLPARYAQPGTIVLRDPVRKEHIRDVVTKAVLHIMQNPKT